MTPFLCTQGLTHKSNYFCTEFGSWIETFHSRCFVRLHAEIHLGPFVALPKGAPLASSQHKSQEENWRQLIIISRGHGTREIGRRCDCLWCCFSMQWWENSGLLLPKRWPEYAQLGVAIAFFGITAKVLGVYWLFLDWLLFDGFAKLRSFPAEPFLHSHNENQCEIKASTPWKKRKELSFDLPFSPLFRKDPPREKF